ncbi:MAG: hypothetical protein COA99_14170, partial [Moraxellaceae bacterium]
QNKFMRIAHTIDKSYCWRKNHLHISHLRPILIEVFISIVTKAIYTRSIGSPHSLPKQHKQTLPNNLPNQHQDGTGHRQIKFRKIDQKSYIQ